MTWSPPLRLRVAARARAHARRLLRVRAEPGTALVVPVPAIEQDLATVRAEFGVPWPDGLPTHVTVMYPFAANPDMTKLADVLSATDPFPYELTGLGRFDGVLYVRPEPAGPFVGLTEKLVRAWPRYVPYDGQFRDVIPHVTVLDQAPEAEGLAAAVQALLPRSAVAEEVWVLGLTARGWDCRARLPLRGA